MINKIQGRTLRNDVQNYSDPKECSSLTISGSPFGMMLAAMTMGVSEILGVHYLGGPYRILVFRVLYWGPLFSETPTLLRPPILTHGT